MSIAFGRRNSRRRESQCPRIGAYSGVSSAWKAPCRRLCFQKGGYPDVRLKFAEVDAGAFVEQAPFLEFAFLRGGQAGEPIQRHADLAAVGEADDHHRLVEAEIGR